MSIRHLDHLFAPRSIAVVGVSARAGNVGAIVLRNLLQADFPGPVWAVDTQPGTVHGVDVVAGVDALRGVPGLALSHQPPMTWIPGMNKLLKLNTYLRTRGTSELVGLCLEENIAMSALARRAGFEIHPSRMAW